MSSLDENGRPRYDLVKVRIDGRLLIARERNARPRIVQTRSEDGKLRMKLALPQDEHEEGEDIDEEEEEREGQCGGKVGLIYLWIHQLF